MGKWVTILLVCMVLLSSFGFAAKIRGAIYDHTLEPIDKSVIYINTTPEQKKVSQYGGYYFVVEPGTYEIWAELTRNGITKEIAREYITISSEGDFSNDLFLFDDFDMIAEFEDTFFVRTGRFFNENAGLFISIGSIIAVLLLGVFSYIAILRKKPLEKTVLDTAADEQEVVTKPKAILSDDDKVKQKIVVILKKEKQMTQKDIRKKFSFSEAKMSLLLSQMEHDAVLLRKKKGRVNVLVLRR